MERQLLSVSPLVPCQISHMQLPLTLSSRCKPDNLFLFLSRVILTVKLVDSLNQGEAGCRAGNRLDSLRRAPRIETLISEVFWRKIVLHQLMPHGQVGKVGTAETKICSGNFLSLCLSGIFRQKNLYGPVASSPRQIEVVLMKGDTGADSDEERDQK